MQYQINRGNFCEVTECGSRARIKGLCTNCYQNDKKKERLILKILAQEF